MELKILATIQLGVIYAHMVDYCKPGHIKIIASKVKKKDVNMGCIRLITGLDWTSGENWKFTTMLAAFWYS